MTCFEKFNMLFFFWNGSENMIKFFHLKVAEAGCKFRFCSLIVGRMPLFTTTWSN